MKNILIKSIKVEKGVRDIRVSLTIRPLGVKSAWIKDVKSFPSLDNALEFLKSLITSKSIMFVPFTQCSRIVNCGSYTLDDKAYYLTLNTGRGIRKYYLTKGRDLLTYKVSVSNIGKVSVSYETILLDNPLPSKSLFTKEELDNIPDKIKKDMRILVKG